MRLRERIFLGRASVCAKVLGQEKAMTCKKPRVISAEKVKKKVI